jgi:hypothetical protein
MQVYDPTAPSPVPAKNLRRTVGDLNGKVVGFIDNTKPNFNLLIDDLARLLSERYGVQSVIKHVKRSVATPAVAQVLDDLASQCDLVVTGSGD